MAPIRIYVTHQEFGGYIKTDIIKPIHVGKKLASSRDKALMCHFLPDDAGDNISDLNDFYCELTGIYWAWKNDGDSEYIGFMQPERHFIFNAEASLNTHFLDGLSTDYLKATHLSNSDAIEQYLFGKDFIVPIKYTENHAMTGVEYFNHLLKRSSPWTQFRVPLAVALDTLDDLIPEYKVQINRVFHSNDYPPYSFNSFIAKREVFFDLCAWLFPLLEEVHSKIDYTLYSERERRFIGVFAERLINIYLMRRFGEDHDALPSLALSHVENISFQQSVDYENDETIKNASAIDTQFVAGKSRVHIASACNERYFPLFAAMVESLIENRNPNRSYTVHFLENSISSQNLNYIHDRCFQCGIELNLVDSEPILKDFFGPDIFNRDSYARLFLPDLLNKIERVVYVDCDTILADDIGKLYDIDLEGRPLGAVHDLILELLITAEYKCTAINSHLTIVDYLRSIGLPVDEAKLPEVDYFQNGVLVMDLGMLRSNEHIEKALEISKQNNFEFCDQDATNVAFKGQIKEIPSRWNLVSSAKDMKFLPLPRYQQYEKDLANPGIIHYAGQPGKPWGFEYASGIDYFWKYAARTPYMRTLADRFICKSPINEPNAANSYIPLTAGVQIGLRIDALVNRLFPPESRRRYILGSVLGRRK